MSAGNTVTLLLNGLTLALALGFLIIVLWHDARKELNQFFAAFLLLVIMWNMGSLGVLAISLIDPETPLVRVTISVMELGFTGSSIAVYSLTAILIGIHSRRFRVLAFLGLLIVLGYQLVLYAAAPAPNVIMTDDGVLRYRFQPVSALFYLVFDGVALYLVWRYRKKIKSKGLLLGLNLFVIGQSLGFLNPELETTAISTNLCAAAALLISFSILRQEIIVPLGERVKQVEAVHKVSLAISSHIAINTVLNQIATQAAGWLSADASGIFLLTGEELELVAVHNLPKSYLHVRVKLGEGVIGKVAQEQESIYLENYGRDWRGKSDLYLAKDVFGSVISVPLIYDTRSIGVLLVIAGRQGRLFQREDVQLLELLGAQAAVAIAHSRLFDDQERLNRQIEAARSQMESVLSSTENPVVALDRSFRSIFMNPAAKALLQITGVDTNYPIINALPSSMMPPSPRQALRDLRTKRAHIYELTLEGKTYLCHVTPLGDARPLGWVAVLNDVTQLKELDRLKSEMVRMTSHDLKNPLQAAMANLELLTEDLAAFKNPDIHNALEAVNKQLVRMNRIIGGILDLERVKSGSLHMELCNLESTVLDVINDMEHQAAEKRVELVTEVEPTPPILADPEQIERALVNLIENAIKFTGEAGRVVVRLRPNAVSNQVILEVEDTGVGIPEKLQPFVFERFWRGAEKGQEGTEHISGTGLGLSLVKTIIENHHGEIQLTSQVGQGTVFSIRFQAAVEPILQRSYREKQ
ncbi:MAG: GAF domain-containing protein [Anaerolineae bacterium]|nr:GAF domain-containing protein [Anaerolineae bacterium]